MQDSSNQLFNPDGEILRRLIFVENQLNNLQFTLTPYFLGGRLRFDRPAPTSSTNVVAPYDLENDVVIFYPNYYILVNNNDSMSPALIWAKFTLNSF